MQKIDIKSKTYKMKNENFKALDNIKFELGDNGIVCVLGPSGSGKTTLMNIMGALDSDFDGDVIINNKSLKNAKGKDLDNYRKNTIGFVFQQFFLINKFSAFDNVKVALDLSNKKRKKERVMELLKKVEMDKFTKRKVNLLSGGQKQRVAIARALANDPDIILADEPTGALDSKMSNEIMELLENLSKTKLIVVITHSRELADKYADRIITMQDGKILSIEDNKIKQEENNKNDEIEIEHKNDKKQVNLSSSNELKKSKMSFFKAFIYSLKNMSKRKARLIATAIGMSIGIVGIGLALALSNGTMDIAKAQVESLAPMNLVTITPKTNNEDENELISNMNSDETDLLEYSQLEKIKALNENITHFWSVPVFAFSKGFFSETSLSEEDIKTVDYEDKSFMMQNGLEPYENVGGNLTLGNAPKNKDEVVISLNTADFLLGDNSNVKIEDLIGKELYVKFGPMEKMTSDSDKNKILKFTIVGITSFNTLENTVYQMSTDTFELYQELYNEDKNNLKLSETYLYLNNNLTKDEMLDIINNLNNSQDEFKFTSTAESIMSNVEKVLNVVRNVLIGFSSISVLVAILMIGIVIYISVIERISEIGILRAIGARKKDILNIFISESVIIGLLSGIIGVGVTKLLCEGINNIAVTLMKSYGLSMGNIGIAKLSDISALGILLVCVILSIIAGIIPSLKAAKMDPVKALRRS